MTIETEEFVYNGFTSVYTIASILIVGCILQIVFFVKDTKPPPKERIKVSELMSTERIKESMRTVFKKREDSSRNVILALCLAYFFMAINYGGIFISGSLWLFFQKLGWEYVQFTTYLGILSGVILIGCLTVIPLLLVKFKLSDMTIALVATLAAITNCVLMFCTPYNNTWVPYVGTVMMLTQGFTSTAIKSTLTKVVRTEEVMQVLAFLGITLPINILGPPAFNLIYRASLDFGICEGGESGKLTFPFLGQIQIYLAYWDQCVTVPIILNNTNIFFRYQIFSIPIPVLFSVPNFSETFSDTKFDRYRFRDFFRYQIFPIPVPRLFSGTKFFRYHQKK